MGRITMMKGGVQGVIATLLSYVDGGDIIVGIIEGVLWNRPSQKWHEV